MTSSYLRQFAARMVDGRPAAAVRPRGASLFEAAGDGDAGPSRHRDAPMAMAEAKPERLDRIERGIDRPSPSALTIAEVDATASTVAPLPSAPDPRDSPTPPLPAAMARPDRPAPAATPPPIADARHTGADTPPIVAARALSMIDTTAKPMAAQPSLRPAPMPERRPSPLPAAPFIEPQREPAVRPSFDPPLPIPPTLAPRRGEPMAPPPTVVQVTIGAVEVRSPAPPARRAAPPSRAAPGPRLTLREYLQRRNEGRR